MERIRIDRRDQSLRARQRTQRGQEDAEASLRYRAGGGADIDDDLLVRIDALLEAHGPTATAN
ncbi:hypothetical protein BH23ACT9_BH23ACT9_27490 [soil metagenome]